MKNIVLLLLLLVSLTTAGQTPKAYITFIQQAESLYQNKMYKESADAYTKAFEANGWMGSLEDRYNAACAWSRAGNPDSAFFQLERITQKANFSDLQQLTNDNDLNNIHPDKRWAPLCALVKANKEKTEANFDMPLVNMLDSVYTDDQSERLTSETLIKKYGLQSKEVQTIWEDINKKDSINLIKVRHILDTRGWLGPDLIGQKGNNTLFLVIQHADIATQKKYLPMMREAVKKGNAQASSLALLEDRVALREGRKQIYGSQIGMSDGKYYVSPLEDPDNVDKRRAEVGLEPLANYLQYWDLKWDVTAYKKQLPEIEKMEKHTR